MKIPAALEAAFPRSGEILLDRLRRHVDDAMLMDVARADYGHQANEMFALLRPIRDHGIIHCPMPGQLQEVLSLTRYCNPEKPDASPFDPGPTGRRGHFTRLFACAVLLRATAEFENRHIDPSAEATLAQCLVSAKILGDEMSEAAAQFLTWRLDKPETMDDQILFALGLLVLAVRLRSERINDAVLETAADWLLSEESAWVRGLPYNPWNLADPMPAPFGIQSGFWQPLAAELKTEAAAIGSAELRTKLQLCELLLE
jgi:hypothetical protein